MPLVRIKQSFLPRLAFILRILRFLERHLFNILSCGKLIVSNRHILELNTNFYVRFKRQMDEIPA